LDRMNAAVGWINTDEPKAVGARKIGTWEARLPKRLHLPGWPPCGEGKSTGDRAERNTGRKTGEGENKKGDAIDIPSASTHVFGLFLVGKCKEKGEGSERVSFGEHS